MPALPGHRRVRHRRHKMLHCSPAGRILFFPPFYFLYFIFWKSFEASLLLADYPRLGFLQRTNERSIFHVILFLFLGSQREGTLIFIWGSSFIFFLFLFFLVSFFFSSVARLIAKASGIGMQLTWSFFLARSSFSTTGFFCCCCCCCSTHKDTHTHRWRQMSSYLLLH